MIDCDSVRAELLELDWDEAGRERMRTDLAHVDTCESCRSAMKDFDQIRPMVALPESEIEPARGWPAFEAGLSWAVGSRPPRRRSLPVALAASILLAAVGWWKAYGGLRRDQARRFKELERENARLKKLVAEQALDNAILKEAAYPNC